MKRLSFTGILAYVRTISEIFISLYFRLFSRGQSYRIDTNSVLRYKSIDWNITGLKHIVGLKKEKSE